MPLQEIKQYVQRKFQYLGNYIDRRKIVDPSLKERIHSFDVGAPLYPWPAIADYIPSRKELFQSDRSAVRILLINALTSHVLRPEPSNTPLHFHHLQTLSLGSTRAFNALLWRLEQLESFSQIADGTESAPWEQTVADLQIAAGKSKLTDHLHSPIFPNHPWVRAPQPQTKQDKISLTIEDPTDILEKPGRFLTPPTFSQEAIERLHHWDRQKLVELAYSLPKLPETARLPEELATFANFYSRLYEVIKDERINMSQIDDDFDNLVARRILIQIAIEISDRHGKADLYHLARSYSGLVKRRSIEELRERLSKQQEQPNS